MTPEFKVMTKNFDNSELEVRYYDGGQFEIAKHFWKGRKKAHSDRCS